MDHASYSAKKTVIAIAGVGGGGGNAINYMCEKGIEGVKFIAFNTDFQDLYNKSKADIKVALGTEGLGAGAQPHIGKEMAEQSKKDIEKHLEGCDMVFITAGMGGGTGTGAAPVIAKVAKGLGILTIGIVTKPFEFEGTKKMKTAIKGIEELQKNVDALIVIPNEKLFKITEDKDLPVKEAYKLVNQVLQIGVKSIIGLIQDTATVSLDFNDVKTVLAESGIAAFGFGVANDDQDPIEAVTQAINNPLLEQSMKGAKNVLVYLVVNNKFSMRELKQISSAIREQLNLTGENDFIHGFNEVEGGPKLQLTIIASNFDRENITSDETFVEREFDETKDKSIYDVLYIPVYDEKEV